MSNFVKYSKPKMVNKLQKYKMQLSQTEANIESKQITE